MTRELAIVAIVLAFACFFLGVLTHASQMLGMAILWALALLFLLVALISGAHAVLIDRFPPKG